MNYQFEIDQEVYNKVSGDKGVVCMLRSITDKDADTGKYFTVREYYVYETGGYIWLREELLSKHLVT